MAEKKDTRKKLVLDELLSARYGKQYRYNAHEMIPEGWVPSWVLVSPAVGGLQGLRRLRELRESGIMIEHRFFYRTLPDGTKQRTNTTIYRLITAPSSIDREKCCLKSGQLELI